MTVDLRIRSTVGNESVGFETAARLVIGGNKDRWIFEGGEEINDGQPIGDRQSRVK